MVWDTAGTRYLDASAGLWYANVGHGRTEIGEAVARQIAKLASYSTFGPYTTQPTLDLAERIANLAPVPGATVFFGSGGSDAVVSKLNATASSLVYSTFLGGPDNDGAYGLALDRTGNAYVTGPVPVAAGFTGFPASATGWAANGPSFNSAPSATHSCAVARGMNGLSTTASTRNPSAAV